ncbi:MAG: apolipoprotein N-acyltransferase [Candidatus Omnitrophica bacterium]|nr:apolipoprotein N-acyltransferase [Candidatus Omnitrophota bacterium]
MKKIFLCILSAIFLTLSFPKINLSLLAFVALVPLMLALDGLKAKKCFSLSYFCGALFFFMVFFWVLFVTRLGTVFLLAFLSLYFGLFGLGYCWLSQKRVLAKIFLIPALWVSIEYVRAHFLTGFGWALLGHSQYQNLWLIQMADMTGVYGISFLVVMVNVIVTEPILLGLKLAETGTSQFHLNATLRKIGAEAVFAKQKPPLKEFFVSWAIVSLVFGASVVYSLLALKNNFEGPKIKVGVAQGNISLERRWRPQSRPFILRDYFAFSEELVKEKVDLIVWPESSYPGIQGEQPEFFALLKDFIAETKTPHLIGIITQEGNNYFNSALLFSSQGEVVGRYDKLHLVPFGEYLPLRKKLPFLAGIVPIDDFLPGNQYTLFKVSQRSEGGKAFFCSVLICFEDTIPELASGFVKNGANLLVNISNDAWFGDTKEPFLHLQSAVFRSIENRRYLVRCGNVGVSCFVDPYGRIVSRVEAQGKSAYVSGARAQDVFLINAKTIYTKFGDFFAYFCISGILVMAILNSVHRPKKESLAVASAALG